MKKVLIITLFSDNNFGNKLQNYALQQTIIKLDSNILVRTQKIKYEKITDNHFEYYIWKIYSSIKNIFKCKKINQKEKCFLEFDSKFINYTDKYVGSNTYKKIKNYDYYIYGSDQVWNPFGVGNSNFFLGGLSDNNFSYAASLSTNEIPISLIEKYKRNLSSFKKISVRETVGKKLLESILNRNDIDVLVDPTMLLSSDEWDKISKKPKNFNEKKYILNYFLGDLSKDREESIIKVANDNDCTIINILDKNSPYYNCGPQEFLYLEKNAFLICTDSFHSSVFAFLFNKPFIVFERDDSENDMSSRIDQLLCKFDLRDRKYDGKISNNNLKIDYSNGKKILKNEIKKSLSFLKDSLDIKERDN